MTDSTAAALDSTQAQNDFGLRAPVSDRPLSVVTGGSSGIGLELARLCARHGGDLIVAADRPDLATAAEQLEAEGAKVTAVRVDLATPEGVDELVAAVRADGRPLAHLIANAGEGQGGAFLDQDFDDIRHIVDTNVTGTLLLLHKLAPDMIARGAGRVLITGSIAGHLPGTFQAVYNATKAFIDNFSIAFRNELKDTGVSVTCLLPGATDTNFFKEAGMTDTRVANGPLDDPADVARTGWEAMMKGEASVIHGVQNKMQVAAAKLTPDTVLAEQHRKMAEPGGADKN
jgi:short-subunit dehydrogenase